MYALKGLDWIEIVLQPKAVPYNSDAWDPNFMYFLFRRARFKRINRDVVMLDTGDRWQVDAKIVYFIPDDEIHIYRTHLQDDGWYHDGELITTYKCEHDSLADCVREMLENNNWIASWLNVDSKEEIEAVVKTIELIMERFAKLDKELNRVTKKGKGRKYSALELLNLK